mmetsp:Transcript_766/g.1820  ORF Transcript_766/g.1820 Transcript_766/m.1820 type:complete len:331 (-) Transcript_766:364-1356(-)|eukprot:jgi/Tetstr1/458648/TSEL_045041.t1
MLHQLPAADIGRRKGGKPDLRAAATGQRLSFPVLLGLLLPLLTFGAPVTGRGGWRSPVESREVTQADDQHRSLIKIRVQQLLGSWEEREAAAFLVDNMPPPDVGSLPDAYLATNVRLAMQAWKRAPWRADVPWDIFLNYVAPYAVLDEHRDPWRPMLVNLVGTLLAGVTDQGDAVMALNRDLWGAWEPPIHFVADQAPQTLSPFQVIEARNASCSGLSIFLVDALRAGGLPARVAGVPQWNTPSGGNHNWVEVWILGEWHFLGAGEPDAAGLDHAWFYPDPVRKAVPGAGMRSVFATSWAPTPGGLHFPLYYALEKTYVHAYEVTPRYIA